MAMSELPVSRTSKRGDTWEPVMVRATDANGPFDLTGATLRLLAKAVINGVDTIIDSAEDGYGIVVNVEDADGPGADEIIEWPIGSGFQITVPENRGWARYEQTEIAVSLAAIYEVELEATKGGKVITFPNKEEKNPRWEISPDIRVGG